MKSLTVQEKRGIINKYEADPQRILNILLDLQFESEDGYIDEETAKLVAEQLHLSEARVYELITFYAILKSEPQAKYVIKVCSSSPCLFNKGKMVMDTLETVLGVPADQMTPDGLFMYHTIPCMGACDKSPAIKIKDTVFEALTEEKIYALIRDLIDGKYENL